MKATFIFLVVLFAARTSFAKLESILVEVVAHRGGQPTVNIYAPNEADQRADASIAEAASALHAIKRSLEEVIVFVTAEDMFIPTDDLLTVLDGMRGNRSLRLLYVRTGIIPDSDKQRLNRFKIPEYTKAPKP